VFVRGFVLVVFAPIGGAIALALRRRL